MTSAPGLSKRGRCKIEPWGTGKGWRSSIPSPFKVMGGNEAVLGLKSSHFWRRFHASSYSTGICNASSL